MSDKTLDLETLEKAVRGGVAAFRVTDRLQPAGGPNDKIFPPTYATGDRSLKYAVEKRRVDGEEVECVLVDSVASQANRMEEVLARAWEEERAHFPMIRVDFSDRDDIDDLDHISTLEAPHRVYDALLRDSVSEDGTLFRNTPLGKAVTEASPKAATPLFEACPTVLVFGGWDSTGPKGGLGTKVQRALVSELVAINATTGKKTASRLDPTGIQANVDVFHRKDDRSEWTIDEDEAEKKKGKPVPFSRKGAEGKGKPSAINHSNVAPTIDEYAGGVTCDYVLQTAVLSLPALRRLRFPTDCAGQRLEGAARIDAEYAARTALAALGLLAMSLVRDEGFDLRSRCALVPEHPMVVEAVSARGEETRRYDLLPEAALALFRDAADKAAKHGFQWKREPIRLKPSDKLAALIAKSRELAKEGAGDEEEAS